MMEVGVPSVVVRIGMAAIVELCWMLGSWGVSLLGVGLVGESV